jgi:hypothetical protein
MHGCLQTSVQFLVAVKAFRSKPFSELPKLARELFTRFLKVRCDFPPPPPPLPLPLRQLLYVVFDTLKSRHSHSRSASIAGGRAREGAVEHHCLAQLNLARNLLAVWYAVFVGVCGCWRRGALTEPRLLAVHSHGCAQPHVHRAEDANPPHVLRRVRAGKLQPVVRLLPLQPQERLACMCGGGACGRQVANFVARSGVHPHLTPHTPCVRRLARWWPTPL